MPSGAYDTRSQNGIRATGLRRVREFAFVRGTLAVLVATFWGCASYAPKPLPTAPDWPDNIAGAAAPLTVDQVVERALTHSPDVRRAERELDIANAHKYAEGLLPDPQLSFSTDRPGATGFIPAFMVGLSYEVSALVDHPAKQRAAAAATDKQQLTLQWTRWQVANHAYALYVSNVSLARVEAEVAQLVVHEQVVADRMRQALARGDVTRDIAVQSETAYRDGLQQLDTLGQDHLKAQQELAALLDLRPGTHLMLAAPPEPYDVPLDAVHDALANLSQRRPDLLALRAGYAEQDERYRTALLGQFPRLDIGITRGRDTSAIYTSGIAVTVTLPLFNGNRGNIAVEKATRESLYEEYTQRLKEAYAAVDNIVSNLDLLDEQLRNTRSIEASLEQATKQARIAHGRGDVTLPTLMDLESRRLNQRIAITKLENAVFQQQVELCTLIGVSAIDHQSLQ
ncbi:MULTISPECIES: TolC family protein [Paraburkholderia]|uniref:TolC family protein n=1 Tax=Paraburkholderia podalyriae TaxID=1938811 RepID=A0ABR7PYN7_9BURK|nr:TolC family protein [Paraburkholderia podalyriae]MBC8751410.1 TolC family protein [Paraburkholderia podalyriae]